MRPGSILRQTVVIPAITPHLPPGCNILDIGGYDGSVSAPLASHGHKVTVVDVDDEGLKMAKTRGLFTIRASATQLPFENNSFDVVLMIDVINALPKEFVEKTMQEAGRVLREDGLFCLTVLDKKFSLPFSNMQTIWKSWNARPGYESVELEHLFELADAKIVYHERYYSWLTRFTRSVLFVHKIPSRGDRLRKRIWQFVVRLERTWRPLPHAHLMLARVSRSEFGLSGNKRAAQ